MTVEIKNVSAHNVNRREADNSVQKFWQAYTADREPGSTDLNRRRRCDLTSAERNIDN